MPRELVCPKCSSQDVVAVPGDARVNSIALGITVFNTVRIDRHVCCKCGFVESWIDDRDGLDAIRERFKQS